MAEGPEPPYRIRWELPAPHGDALSPAVIAGDVAYTLGREAVYAVDVASGDVRWEVPRDGPFLASPALTGDGTTLLFVDGPEAGAGTRDGATPTPTASPSPDDAAISSGTALVALDVVDGDERWRADLPADSRSGVTVEGTTAFVAGVDGSITAIDVGNGSATWSDDVGGPIEVPLTVADATVVAVVRDVGAREVTIVARSATDGSQTFAPLTSRIGSTAASSAAVVGGAIVVGMPDRLVHAISADGGTELWTSLALSVFSPASSAAFAGDTVYVADVSGGLYALDRASGERAWAFQFNDLVVRSAPVRVGGHVLVGLATGRLVAVDAETGHLVWSGRGGPGLVGTIAVGADVVVAVSGGRDAGLVAYEADPEGALVDVASPTELDTGVTLPRIALGAVIAIAVILIPGVLYRRRFGPVSLEEGIGD
ncbi:MAG TPA: PQQ-binding-like beta-propeller repeat protein, partial [Actinomycetota bacterium]|nr:PQQ-binding-like beta-propeller repeat protein [Actinomycetota bacterium]